MIVGLHLSVRIDVVRIVFTQFYLSDCKVAVGLFKRNF